MATLAPKRESCSGCCNRQHLGGDTVRANQIKALFYSISLAAMAWALLWPV